MPPARESMSDSLTPSELASEGRVPPTLRSGWVPVTAQATHAEVGGGCVGRRRRATPPKVSDGGVKAAICALKVA